MREHGVLEAAQIGAGSLAGSCMRGAQQSPQHAPLLPATRLQRSSGAGHIAFKTLGVGAAARTVVEDLRQSGCIRLRVPRTEPRVAASAVVINTAGGLTDGDEIALSATWTSGTHAALTSQAAERVYRARAGSACMTTSLRIAAGATGLWLPQETILFDGGRYRRRIDVAVDAGGCLLACESLIVGRRAMGERVTAGSVHDGWRVRHDGRLVLADALRLEGDLERQLDRPALGNGARALATILVVGVAAEACLAPARSIILSAGATAGASLVGPCLVVRLLAADGAGLRRDLTSLLSGLLAALAAPARADPRGPPPALPRLWHF